MMMNDFLDRGPVARHARAQIAGGEILHDDVGMAFGEAVFEHLGHVRAVDARRREIFLHEARQQVRVAAAFALEHLEHDLLFVRPLAQAHVGGGAAAQWFDQRETLDARGLEHLLGVGEPARLDALRSCWDCLRRVRAASMPFLDF